MIENFSENIAIRFYSDGVFSFSDRGSFGAYVRFGGLEVYPIHLRPPTFICAKISPCHLFWASRFIYEKISRRQRQRLPLEGKLSAKQTDEVEIFLHHIRHGVAVPPSPQGEGSRCLRRKSVLCKIIVNCQLSIVNSYAIIIRKGGDRRGKTV